MKCSKKYAKEDFLSDDVFIFISNTPKSKVFNFVFSVRTGHVFFYSVRLILLNLKCFKCTSFLI